MLGSGAVIVMDETRCMVKCAAAPVVLLLRGIVRPVHAVPRRHRLAVPHGQPHRARRRARSEDLDLLNDVADNIAGRTICALGDAAALPVKSFIKHFRDEFQHHIDHKRLPGPALRLTTHATHAEPRNRRQAGRRCRTAAR